jgi:hypothetical protein
MATYLSGVTDYIPQIQPFAPDINLYAKVLQTKQSKYDANWQSLNNVYSQYFYADLSREDNQERRDELMKAIDGNLKKVSGLDLSLEQNVRQAKQLFTPFYEDKYLMRDMVYTKNYTQERNRGLSYKNARNEKDRENYWDAGVRYLDYKMEEFKGADLSETLNFGGVSYTPFVNIQKKAMELAKQFGDIETPSFSPDGRYMIVNRNGEQLREPLHRLFEASFGNDPAAQEMFQVLAYVNRKDYAQTNASLFGGDAKQAEMKYLQDQFENFSKQQKLEFENQQDNLKVINNKISDLERQEKNGSLSDAGKKALREYKYSQEIIQTNLDRAEKLNEELNTDVGVSNTGKGFQNPYEDIETLRRKVDGAVANSLFSKQLQEAAQIYSIRNMKQTVTADPYAVIDYKHQKSKELANYKQKLKNAEEQQALDSERDILGILTPGVVAPEGSADVSEPITPLALARTNLQTQKNKINQQLNVVVNHFSNLVEARLITPEELKQITGYSDINSLKQAQANEKLINNVISKNFNFLNDKGELDYSLNNIKNTLVNFRKSVKAGKNKEQLSTQYTTVTGKNLDNIMENTFDYLNKNKEISGVRGIYQEFAGSAESPYWTHKIYKETKKEFNDWYEKNVKPLAKDLADTKTYFNVFFGEESDGYKERDKLYRVLGKEKIMEIFVNSSSEEIFYKNLEKELTEKYKYPIILADYLGFGMSTQSGKGSQISNKPVFIKPSGLYDKLQENLAEVMVDENISLPPNIAAYSEQIDPTTGALGTFSPQRIGINAYNKDLTSPGTIDFVIATRTLQSFSKDVDFAFNGTISGIKEIQDKYKDKIGEIQSLFKDITRNYLTSKDKGGIAQMVFSPMAAGSGEKHSLQFKFNEEYLKTYKDRATAIGEDFYNQLLINGSFTAIAPAGSFNEIPFAKGAQYTQFENMVMGKKDGVTYKTNQGFNLKFKYEGSGGFSQQAYDDNGRLLENPFNQTYTSYVGAITQTFNYMLANDFIVFQ